MTQLLNECLKLCWVHTETVFDMFQLKRFSSKQFRYVHHKSELYCSYIYDMESVQSINQCESKTKI